MIPEQVNSESRIMITTLHWSNFRALLSRSWCYKEVCQVCTMNCDWITSQLHRCWTLFLTSCLKVLCNQEAPEKLLTKEWPTASFFPFLFQKSYTCKRQCANNCSEHRKVGNDTKNKKKGKKTCCLHESAKHVCSCSVTMCVENIKTRIKWLLTVPHHKATKYVEPLREILIYSGENWNPPLFLLMYLYLKKHYSLQQQVWWIVSCKQVVILQSVVLYIKVSFHFRCGSAGGLSSLRSTHNPLIGWDVAWSQSEASSVQHLPLLSVCEQQTKTTLYNTYMLLW